MTNFDPLKILPLVIFGALFLGAAPAGAVSPITTHHASKLVSGSGGTTATVTASCPKGTRALGGGYRLPNVNAAGSNVTALMPYVSRRVGQRRWKVAVVKVGDGTRTVPLVVYVRCQTGPSPLSTVKAHRNFAGSSGSGFFPHSVRARCPSGAHPVSGGFQSSINGFSTGSGAPAGVILASTKFGAGWRISSLRFAPGSGRLTAFAYCGAVGTRSESKGFSLGVNQISQRASAPKCPRGFALASGGFVAPLIFSTNMSVALPISSGPYSYRRWSVTAFAEGSDGSAIAPIRVSSYCLRVAPRH